MKLHQHEIGYYIQCPRKFDLYHNKRLVLKTTPKYINIGALFAKAVEALHLGLSPNEAISTIVDTSANKLADSVLSQEQASRLVTDVSIVEAMINGYSIHFLSENPPLPSMKIPKAKRILPEFKMETYMFDDLALITRLDGLLIDTDDKKWILEIKTSVTDGAQLVKQLPINFQINTYWMALDRNNFKDVDGIVYRMVRKPSIRLKKNESVEAYRLRLISDYAERPEFYFSQVPIFFKTNSIREFERDFASWVARLDASRIVGYYARNGFSCKTFSECQYLKYCSDPTQETLNTYYKEREDETVTDRDDDSESVENN